MKSPRHRTEPLKQERSLRTRERIFLAALEDFSAHGYHGARIERIAARARANKQRIYAHFGSKADLFRDVLRQCLSEIGEQEGRLLRLGDGDRRRLGRTLLQHYMRFLAAHPHFWRMLAWENLEGGKHAGVLRGLRQRTFDHLRRLYRRGQQEGAYRADVSFETFIFALSAIAMFYFANQITMSQTLGLNLARPAVRARLIRECERLMGL